MKRTETKHKQMEIFNEEMDPFPLAQTGNVPVELPISFPRTHSIQDPPYLNRPVASRRPETMAIRPVASLFDGDATEFRRRFFPEATSEQWNDWTWQMRNRVTDISRLSRMIRLSQRELAAFQQTTNKLPLSITPYYLGLIDPQDPEHPLRRCVIPSAEEMVASPGEAKDPLGEDDDSVRPGLVHRYPDRVLLLATGSCSTYCRYCTRHRLVAGHGQECRYSRRRLEEAFAYIKKTPSVRDVLISGGDPFLLSDDRLEWIISRLREIDHVEIVRIGTKTPAVLPQRITTSLVDMLRRYHPLFVSIHFTHPLELTPETGQACARLADAGIPLGSQTVLLKGINDQVETLKSLFQGLLKFRVRPYYLYQCDPIIGSAHFRTSVGKGLELMQGLRGHTTGYAVPTYVIDAPGGGGKIPVYPDSVVSREEGRLVLRNYEGQTFVYPDYSDPAGDYVH